MKSIWLRVRVHGKPQVEKPQSGEAESGELLLVRALVMGLEHPVFHFPFSAKGNLNFGGVYRPTDRRGCPCFPQRGKRDDNELRVSSVFGPRRKTANWINFCDIFRPKVKMG